jgi:hypothetical protein
MSGSSVQEHFLDTSVMRSLLLATQAYRQYLESQLSSEPLYISNYVQMEIKRSYSLLKSKELNKSQNYDLLSSLNKFINLYLRP